MTEKIGEGPEEDYSIKIIRETLDGDMNEHEYITSLEKVEEVIGKFIHYMEGADSSYEITSDPEYDDDGLFKLEIKVLNPGSEPDADYVEYSYLRKGDRQERGRGKSSAETAVHAVYFNDGDYMPVNSVHALLYDEEKQIWRQPKWDNLQVDKTAEGYPSDKDNTAPITDETVAWVFTPKEE